jgi:hypothetical protein
MLKHAVHEAWAIWTGYNHGAARGMLQCLRS